ncbi:MAG: hypothetical protein KF708_18615 [Pirellulales bacterium]|nr:hypothetical protein [Pirellulales bacterium]
MSGVFKLEQPNLTTHHQILEMAARTSGSEQIATLIKTPQMEVLQLWIGEGSHMPQHEAEGDVMVQCLEGSLRVEFLDECHVIGPRRLLYLNRGIPFALHGIEDATALLIINAPKQGANVELIGEHDMTE